MMDLIYWEGQVPSDDQMKTAMMSKWLTKLTQFARPFGNGNFSGSCGALALSIPNDCSTR